MKKAEKQARIAYHQKRADTLNVSFREALLLGYRRAFLWLNREMWRHRYAIHKLRFGRYPKSRDEWYSNAYPEDYGYDTSNKIDEMEIGRHERPTTSM